MYKLYCLINLCIDINSAFIYTSFTFEHYKNSEKICIVKNFKFVLL